MSKTKVLFVCTHNSARSQMAEAFLNKFAGDRFEAQSAGIETGKLNPIVVNAMNEIGIDISTQKTKTIQQLLEQNKTFDHVVTVCDEGHARKCPIFPGEGKRLHMGFPDPATFDGNYEQKLEQIRIVRDAIKARIQNWINDYRHD